MQLLGGGNNWGVKDGRVQRAPSAPAPTGGGSRVDKHQIKVHSVHRIFRAIFFVCFFAIVKKFVEKKIGGQEQGGVTTPPPPPPGSAPATPLQVGEAVFGFEFEFESGCYAQSASA